VTSILPSLAFGLAAAGAGALALVMVRFAAGFTRARAPLFAAFAGGVVITVALAHLIPEAVAASPHAPWLVLAGFAGGFVLHGLASGAAHGPDVRSRAALAAVFAIGLHSTLDGLVFSVTYTVDPFIGVNTAMGLVLHEFPETVICFVLLQRAGFSDRMSMVLAFMTAGATTLTAAVISAPFANALDPVLLGSLFAVVAGLLLHVGAAHLISEASEAGFLRGGAAVFAGSGVAALMAMTHTPHLHEDGDHAHAMQPGHTHETAARSSHHFDFRPVSDAEDTPQ